MGTPLASREVVANPNTSVISSKASQPVADEWGLFDPKQAGVEALLKKLMTAATERDSALQELPPREKK